MSGESVTVTPVFWFTGLSGAGKTTIAEGIRAHLEADGLNVLILDGDDVRERLHRDLGFSEEDIKTNNALIAGLCDDLRGDYDVVLVPVISPFRSSRAAARERLAPGFYEIYVHADIETVRTRDVKGLYELADKNVITNLIGYSDGSPYEPPENPDLTLSTHLMSVETAITTLMQFVHAKNEF